MVLRPDSGSWTPFTGLRNHTHWTYHTRYDSSGRAISPTHKPLVDNTQQSQKTSMPPTPQHTRYDSSGRAISPSQRPLADNTQHSQEETDIHTPDGIRTHNPSKRAAADPRLRPRCHQPSAQIHVHPAKRITYIINSQL